MFKFPIDKVNGYKLIFSYLIGNKNNFHGNIKKYSTLHSITTSTKKKVHKFYQFKNNYFCTENNKRYSYDYEAPEKQELNMNTLGIRIAKRIIIGCLVFLFIYFVFLRKYNKLAKKYQLILFNQYLDLKLSEYSSKQLQKKLAHYIYKQDSNESLTVYKIYKQLLDGNKIKLEITPQRIFVIDSISIGAFIFKNGDLFISERILEMSNMNEDEIALFIATEISSNLMEKTTYRILSFYFHEFFLSKNKDSHLDISQTNFINYKMKFFNSFNKYLLFYPETVTSTLFEESEILRLSLQLLNNSNFNLQQSVQIFRKFDEKLKNYPKHYKQNILVSKDSRYYDMCKKFLKIYLIKN